MKESLDLLENQKVGSDAPSSTPHCASEKDAKETRKRIIDLHLQVMADISKFNQKDCRDICAKMHIKLPRELRDLVYSHISTFQNEQILDPSYKPWLTLNKGNGAHISQLHVWDASWVGHDTRSELVQNYYRTSQSFIAYTWYMANSCLASDYWGIEAYPADLITKSLEICMDFDDQVPLGILDILARIPLSTKIVIRIFTDGLWCPFISRPNRQCCGLKKKLAAFYEAWFPVFVGLCHRGKKFQMIIALDDGTQKRFTAQEGNFNEKIKAWLEANSGKYCRRFI